MKNKVLVCIFRIILITTFAMGMVYLVLFVRLSTAPATMTETQFLSACRYWTYIYFAYMLLTVGSLVLSIMPFPATGKPAAILRTGTIAFAAVSNILSIKFVSVFRGYGDAFDAAHAVDDMMRKGEIFVIMSFIGAMLLFFLMISSIYALATLSKEDETEQAAPAKQETK